MEDLTVVQIMLRHSGGSHPYTDTDRLRVAESFRVDLAAWGGVEEVLSIVQDHLTTEDPSAEFAIRYRRLYNRSLAVGDVVAVGETAWALEPSGEWRPVSVQASQLVLPGMHATRFLVTQRWWRGDWRAFTKHEVAENGR
jgi:hypothetical protein